MAKKGNLIVVYGGQFGSEGKGEIVAKIASAYPKITVAKDLWRQYAVRIGGPNAGHTAYGPNGRKVVVQSLPVPSALYGWPAVIGAEAVVDLHQLAKELREYAEATGEVLPVLYLDASAALITDELKKSEKSLVSAIGSTAEGVGAATARKVWRDPSLVVGTNRPQVKAALAPWVSLLYLCHTSGVLNKALLEGSDVLIEGTQGWGLSLHTSGYYPFTTSRECTPQALLAGTGINSKNARSTYSIMVVRTYPIRVGGNSGPLPNEITWDQLPGITPEITTVTKRQRRIAEFSMSHFIQSVQATGPDMLAVTFLDYVFPHLAGCRWSEGITLDEMGDKEVKNYLKPLNAICPVAFVSTGPNSTTTILPAAYARFHEEHPWHKTSNK